MPVSPLGHSLKSGYLAAFFMVACLFCNGTSAQNLGPDTPPEALTAQILDKGLDRHHIWHALLHLNRGTPQIRDPDFLLTVERFSPLREMLATLAYLYSPTPQAVCRFPARYTWLRSELALPELPIAACAEIQEFKDKAPFDDLSLVFATESTTQPASMMGHTFLKVSGANQAGETLAHAVSYYTDTNSINLPKELWESLVSGKKGIFSLTPYDWEIQKYVDKEHRNLWEYKIRTTHAQRELIRNHLFELKPTQLNYFLHRYNCATVLLNVLGLIKALPVAGPDWTTPQDVVRQAQQADLVESTTVHVSAHWTYAHLRPKQSPDFERLAIDFLKSNTGSAPAIDTGAQGHYVSALNSVLRNTRHISDPQWANNQQRLSPWITSEDRPLELPGSLNPAFSVGDSRIALSGLKTQHGLSTLLHVVPASHRLSDAQHAASAETEFLLFSGALEISAQNALQVHQLQVLALTSMPPWDPLLKPLSRQTRIGYGAWTQHPDDPKNIHMQSAWGITYRWLPELDVSLLGGAGLQLQPGTSSFLVTAEVSAIYRPSVQTKTLLGWHHWLGPHNRIRQLKARQMVYPSSDLSLWADMDVTASDGRRRHTVGFGIQKSF